MLDRRHDLDATEFMSPGPTAFPTFEGALADPIRWPVRQPAGRPTRWPRARPLPLPPRARAATPPIAPVHPSLRRWDPAVVRRLLPALRWVVRRWYRAEVTGAEHLSDRAALMVSTHNGSFHTPDMYTLMVAFWERFGPDTPGHGLTHRAALLIPGFGRLIRQLGGVPANGAVAAAALRADRPVLVCPGGDVDALKPWSRRHRITFGGRRGFVRLALREQVPIIPVVSAGAHETMVVLNDGQKLAARVPFARLLRIKTIPLALGVPFGVTPAGIGNLPLPTKVRQRVLPPIHLTDPPEAADDPVVVDRWFTHVRDTMQSALDELAATRRWPVIG